ncbi:glutathione S-transferase [Xenorhabdus mauleonii]|uniref:Glutathione S-transferase n=1 Tax=Xenorhabdus mauleonii TaxID=351675 RepID=A0A1I3LYC3_9GAMM|nr:glutathione S-transferase family protein [Xenorhabdus mauleonii]PHM45339.1 glutathione S-transferase [Xenorhabdus mauleonii]SFI89677.1 glutathione S-transferase [Xenorhabdus mauleonii]
MKIYTYPKSRSLRVLWAIEEIGIPYDSVKVDLFNPDSDIKSPHPRGKIPFCTDEDISISETLAICIYLCEKYAGETLYPAKIEEKAAVNSWLNFALTDLEAPVWGLIKQLMFLPENRRSPDVVNYFRIEANKAVSQVKLIENDQWIAGENFTLADIFMSHTLQWAKFCGIPMDKSIEHYIDRAMNRPAFLIAQERNNR